VFDLPSGPIRDALPYGSSSLSAVNAAGDAVGSILSRNSPVRAILWHDGSVVEVTRAVNDPTWQLLSAIAINGADHRRGHSRRDTPCVRADAEVIGFLIREG